MEFENENKSFKRKKILIAHEKEKIRGEQVKYGRQPKTRPDHI